MIPLFAQATPEPASFLQFWVIIGFIAQTVLSLVTIFVLLANRKQKREVSFEFEPASKEEFEKQRDHCTKRHGELFAAIERVERGTTTQANQRVDAVREEIQAVSREVSALQQATNLQNQQLARLDLKLDRIIENKLSRS